MYGQETLRQVEAHAREVASALDAEAAIPVRVVQREVATSSGSIRRVALEANAAESCVGVIAWMHTFSPAKMWIAGLAALQKPLLHLHTQFNRDLPWAEIDMDFMNLNQSAHGDREFGFMETRMGLRRKTVVGHWRDPQVAARIGTWARAACGWREAQTLEGRPLRRQHAPGRGDRGRQGRGAAPAGRRRRTATASATSSKRCAECRMRRSTPARRGVRVQVRPRPGVARGRRAARVAARRRADRGGAARLPRGGRLQGVHGHVRGLATACRSCRASPCSA